MGLFGISLKRYKVNYNGNKMFLKGALDSYFEGQTVCWIYDLIATDTDYHFIIDGESISPDYQNNAFVIKFTMPNHDVDFDIQTRNTMVIEMPIEENQ